MSLRKKLENDILLLDGAMGTMLQEKGLVAGELPELYNLTHPEIVQRIHEEYVRAGADIITTNTFQANDLKISKEYAVEDIISAGVSLAKQSGAPYVALDIGPLGQMLEPLGTYRFDEAYAAFQKQTIAGEQAGADCIIIETFSDIMEAKIAILAAKENTSLPVFCTLTFQQDGRTFMGADPTTAVVSLEGLGIDAIGINCSLGPRELMPAVEEILSLSSLPVIVQANAGLPMIQNGETVYNISPEEYADIVETMVDFGVRVIGGCCGTTPTFISLLRERIASKSPVRPSPEKATRISSGQHTVVFNQKLTVVGERINPTGKPKLQKAIREGQMDYLLREAIDQIDAGCDVLDINVGLPDIDEIVFLQKTVVEVQAITSAPLQIDSASPKAIETAVRHYTGKPLVNSVNGKQESMDAIFPIVKKYGAAVIGLTLDEQGIPETAQGRFAIAEKLLNTAISYGIPKENLIIDCLALTVSAQQEQAIETLRGIQRIKNELGLKTILGVSNISFGLPSRPLMNGTFLAVALGAGLDAAIINPLSSSYQQVINSYRVLNGQDKNAENYIAQYAVTAEISDVVKKPKSTLCTKEDATLSLYDIILQGRKEAAPQRVEALLQQGMAPLEIIDKHFTPALDEIGRRFEQKTVFLPQLLQAAETVKAGFSIIKSENDKKGISAEDKGTIIIATVQGDIHDIGKNIVAMVLENYGYRVIDLGKDVPVQEVVKAATQYKAPLVGLSALMTTTVISMKETIQALREANLSCAVMVGGAVLNPEHAAFVGADYYAKDAMESVAIAQELFGK